MAKDGLFFKVFNDLDPITKIPIKGAWISCFVICFLSFVLNLEELTFMISLENLLTFSFIDAGVIALRYR